MVNVYLAGPMTGYPEWNFPAFTEGAALLRSLGFAVWSPHERDLAAGFDPTSDGSSFDLGEALSADIEAVKAADVVCLLPGWDSSPGALMECVVAESEGIPWAPLDFVISNRDQIPKRNRLGVITAVAAALLAVPLAWSWLTELSVSVAA